MKNISLKQITVIGTIFMIISGSMLHFIYQLSGSNQIVALFSAVNESVWEHGKLFLLPLIIVLSFEYLKIKNLEKILWIALSQLVIMLSFYNCIFLYIHWCFWNRKSFYRHTNLYSGRDNRANICLHAINF